MTALSDLLSPQSPEQVFQLLLSVYQANGFPVESWQPFGTERTRLMAIATAVSDLSANYIPALAAGGFLDYAKGDWLRLLSQQQYAILYNPATFTKGDILLTNASAQPYTIAAGELIAVFGASGRRYINNEGGTLAGNDTLELSFTAEFAGQAYSDPSSSGTLTLVTPLPGVTLTNPAGDYTDVAHIGAGTGSVTPSGSPVGPHRVIIRIDTSGQLGSAAWSYSTDGAPFLPAGTVTSLNIGNGIVVTLSDGVSGVSFVAEDTYLFATPGTWITQQGANIESDESLAQRDRNRWSTLSQIPTNGFYELLAISVPDVGSQVTQVIVLPDDVVNNKVNIVVAGPLGALPLGTVATIQEYITPRSIGTDWPVVTTPTTQDVTLMATVTCEASQLQAAQSAISDALVAYVQGVGINGVVRIAAVIDAVMEVAGVVDVESVTINGVASNLVLGSSVSFVVASLQPIDFSYITVSG
jgi:hypothetical protein